MQKVYSLSKFFVDILSLRKSIGYFLLPNHIYSLFDNKTYINRKEKVKRPAQMHHFRFYFKELPVDDAVLFLKELDFIICLTKQLLAVFNQKDQGAHLSNLLGCDFHYLVSVIVDDYWID